MTSGRPRRADPQQMRTAYEAGMGALVAWLDQLPADRAAGASVLPGWTVADLVAHLVLVAQSVARVEPVPRGTPALSVAGYLATYAAAAASIDARTRTVGAEHDLAGLRALLPATTARAAGVLDRLGPGDPVVAAGRGPIRLGDFLATRVIEVAVHADDLHRSVPDAPAPPLPRPVARVAVRTLLDVLADRHPGRSVEVRVPPYAAVQCIPGPVHTRGTPPGVVETDPATWLRLAAGRHTWADALASGAIRASGQRADLSPQLPLL